jgi:hypothetical protein
MEDKTAAEIMTHPAISSKKTPPTEISRFNLYPSSKMIKMKDEKLIGVVSRGNIIRNLIEPEFMSNI